MLTASSSPPPAPAPLVSPTKRPLQNTATELSTTNNATATHPISVDDHHLHQTLLVQESAARFPFDFGIASLPGRKHIYRGGSLLVNEDSWGVLDFELSNGNKVHGFYIADGNVYDNNSI